MTRKGKKKTVVEKLFNHGIGIAYTIIIMFAVGIFSFAMLGVFVIIGWWEKIR